MINSRMMIEYIGWVNERPKRLLGRLFRPVYAH